MAMTTEEIARVVQARKISNQDEIQDLYFLIQSEGTKYFPIPYENHSFGVSVLGLLASQAQVDELTPKEMLEQKDSLQLEIGMFDVRYCELLSTDMIAREKKVDRRTISRWRQRGLQSFKFGLENYSRRSDLISWNPGF